MTTPLHPLEILGAIKAEQPGIIGIFLTEKQQEELVASITHQDTIIGHLKNRAPVTLAEWDDLRAKRNALQAKVDQIIETVRSWS